MQVLRQQMGVIDDVPHDDARRVEFNRLHVWSTRMEGSVLLLGTGVAVSDGAAVIIGEAVSFQPSAFSADSLCKTFIVPAASS